MNVAEQLITKVRAMGAGWFVEWRDRIENEAKALFHDTLNALSSEAKTDLITIGQAVETTALATWNETHSVSAVEASAIAAAETAAVASGKVIASDALKLVVASIVATVTGDVASTEPAQTEAPAASTGS